MLNDKKEAKKVDFQPVYDQVQMNSLEAIGKAQTNIEARLLPVKGDAISKVLSISASPKVKISEIFTGEVRISGEVEFCVLYLCEDGGNRVMRYSAQFTDKITSDAIYGECKPFLKVAVPSVEVIAVSGDEIRLSAVVESTLYCDDKREVKFLVGGEGAHFNHDEMAFDELICRGGDNATTSATLQNSVLTSVLTCEHKVAVLDAIALPGTVKVSGIIYTDICGETEDGLLGSYRLETPFTREIEAHNTETGDKVYVCVSATGRQTDNEESVEIEYDMQFEFSVYRTKTVTVASDAFSPEKELLITAQSEQISICYPPLYASDRVDGSITLSEDMAVADNILSVGSVKSEIVSAVSYDGEVLVEGVVTGNIIYYSAEAESENSVAVEIPFSLKERFDGVTDKYEVAVDCVVSSLSPKLRRGNEIDIRASLFLTVCCKKRVTVGVITEITEGEEREKCDCAFTVHVVREGESLWKIAKALGVSVEEIRAQNKGLGEVIYPGERIIIYRCNC